jgi:mannose-6-phosphate isomerase
MLGESRRVEKPWGFELWWAHTDHYAGKVLHVEAGHRLSLQYHRVKDESCYLLAGRIRLVTGTNVHDLETVELEPTACWRNPPGQVHTVEAIETSDILEVSTPQLEDVVRLLDDYGRITPAPESEPRDGAPATPARLFDRDQVAARLNISREEFRRRSAEPGFPQPEAYFRGRLLWTEAAIEELLTGPPDVASVTLSA